MPTSLLEHFRKVQPPSAGRQQLAAQHTHARAPTAGRLLDRIASGFAEYAPVKPRDDQDSQNKGQLVC
eukprot:CAMPEP_0172676336 /NCGR_PEP_ID=MMETSP1074-20121228/13907_1 /TAXON_ID=2916 /ORGANISM="Ceratium fusus, Strain PA161109" /LENGTH=67 /DNA_ID=CAMNT_0013493981 /DNA_START=130 /DNA_END=331 /DNA_ORIENTATION=-